MALKFAERQLPVMLTHRPEELPAWAGPKGRGPALPPAVAAEVATLRDAFRAGEWHRQWLRIHRPQLAVRHHRAPDNFDRALAWVRSKANEQR